MPDTYIRFSDLKDSHPSPIDGANDLLAIAHKDTQSATGYNSMSVTPNALGAHAVEDQTFVNLHTTQKTVEGAINEIADSGSSHAYSTTEQVVGTWIDGRPIYEKTVAISESNFVIGWKWFTANLTCDHLIDAEVWLKDDNPTYCYAAMPVAVDFSNGNIGVCNNMGGTMGNVTGYVTVRYTKATP